MYTNKLSTVHGTVNFTWWETVVIPENVGNDHWKYFLFPSTKIKCDGVGEPVMFR